MTRRAVAAVQLDTRLWVVARSDDRRICAISTATPAAGWPAFAEILGGGLIYHAPTAGSFMCGGYANSDAYLTPRVYIMPNKHPKCAASS